MLQDLRLALRSLLKNRGFAAVAILTIALGVGANTAVFSVVNALLLEPLPYREADRLAAVYETAQRETVERRSVSYPNFLDWQREARSFERLSAAVPARFTMTVGDAPERVDGELVSWTYFDLLGIGPARGRGFEAGDDRAGGSPVIVLSDAFWRLAFDADPSVVGRAVRIDGELCTIVGIMPPGFTGLSDQARLWAPIGRFTNPGTLEDRRERWMDVVVARLRPGVTIDQARAEMVAIAARIDEMHPSAAGVRGAEVGPLRDEFVGPMRPMLLVLLGAVGFVLLIACVNVANLLLARGSARERELAVRSALGARRGRIVRQLLTESVTLSMLGGAAGLLAAGWSVDLLVALTPVSLPSFATVGVDVRVLGFTFAVCVASGLLFGVMPALMASRTNIVETLKTGGRGGGEAGSGVLRQGLVAAEIGLAVVLLIGAGLMLRTLEELQRFDPGFRPEGLVAVRLTLPGGDGPGAGDAAARRAEFARTLLERVRALPTVTAASLSTDVPLGTSSSATIARPPGRDDVSIRVYRHAVSPGYFATIGARLLEGRDLAESDARAAEPRPLVVSRSLAARQWAGNALHQRLRVAGREYEVIGIVDDIQHRTLLEPDSADPDVFMPLFPSPAPGLAVLARSAGDPRPLVDAIRRTVHEIDGAVPVFDAALGEELVARQTSGTRFAGALLGAFALVALALTMIGVYGVTAYAVSRQTRQVGIRMALGATRGDVLRLVLGGGAVLIAAGLAAGTVGALALTRFMGSLIYGVSATDPATFLVVAGLLALVALAACLVPAARATRIDPSAALRDG